jgi:L-asparagine transporter-like permease
MVAVLISMGIAEDTRSQLVLSLVSLAVVLLLYLAARRRIQAGADRPELLREG